MQNLWHRHNGFLWNFLFLLQEMSLSAIMYYENYKTDPKKPRSRQQNFDLDFSLLCILPPLIITVDVRGLGVVLARITSDLGFD